MYLSMTIELVARRRTGQRRRHRVRRQPAFEVHEVALTGPGSQLRQRVVLRCPSPGWARISSRSGRVYCPARDRRARFSVAVEPHAIRAATTNTERDVIV